MKTNPHAQAISPKRFYRGRCFPCGTVVIGGTLFVYYGAADKYCAVATCDFGQLLEHLRQCPA